MKSFPSEEIPETRLDQIGTCWGRVQDPAYVVARYAAAIRSYLEALLRDAHDAEEAAQDFLLRVLERGLRGARPERGRFRDYLKKAVRNAGLNYLRDKSAARRGTLSLKPEAVSDPVETGAEQRWLAQWRQILLDRSWHVLQEHERRAPDSLYHTVLRLVTEHPQEDSSDLAARVSMLAGRTIRSDAFRKQLSRARRLFAGALFKEVAQTLHQPTAAQIEEELTDLGLIGYVRAYLPAGWLNRVEPGSAP